jgi:hypothetical protein
MYNGIFYYYIVNVFIVFSLIYMIFWDTNYKKNISIMNPVIMYLGLWHSWCMFSNPSRVVDIIYAIVKHKDGAEKVVGVYSANDLSFMGQSAKNIRLVKIAENIVYEDGVFVKYFTKYLYRKYKRNNISEVSIFLDRTLLPGIKTGMSGRKLTKLYTHSE